MHDVSSWFVDQLNKPSSKPKRVFTMGSSDYSDNVLKWPVIKKDAEKTISAGVKVSLDNTDGGFNSFFENTYLMVSSCQLKIGFTHATSGDELITLYTGGLSTVKYSKNKCNLKLKDALSTLSTKIISNTNSPVSISATIPSDIAWTLCTCYGQLSEIQSTSNPDIDYNSFLDWSAQFSASNITMAAYYKGEKVIDAISKIALMTDSNMWTGGDGKIKFARFLEMSSDYITINEGYNKSITIDVNKTRLINKVEVGFDYSVNSDYWTKTVVNTDSASINSFGTYELLIQDATIWHVSSVNALNLAARKLRMLKNPPIIYSIKSDLVLSYMEVGDNMSFVDSFYSIVASQGWAITLNSINMQTGDTDYTLDAALTGRAFYLDISFLDGDDLLL